MPCCFCLSVGILFKYVIKSICVGILKSSDQCWYYATPLWIQSSKPCAFEMPSMHVPTPSTPGSSTTLERGRERGRGAQRIRNARK